MSALGKRIRGAAALLMLWGAEPALAANPKAGRAGAGPPGALSVKDFGAYCDDQHDDREAIQAALDSGAGAPTRVMLPSGTCRICSIGNGRSALYINFDNVTLEGQGRDQTVLKFYTSGCRNPSAAWDLVNGAVWRGHGIVVTGPARRNFVARAFRLTGQIPRSLARWPLTSPVFFPADPATGEGWDLTNKGIYFQENQSHSGDRIEDVEIDGFKGELIYYGGAGMDDITIVRSRLHDSLASMVSVSARMILRDSELFLGQHAVENSPFDKDNTVENNYVHDNNIGVVFTANVPGAGVWAKTRVVGNTFRKNARSDVWVTGHVGNVDIVRNTFIDSSPQIENGAVRVLDQYGGTPSNVLIESNEFQADTLSPWCAFYPSFGEGRTTSVVFVRNRITRTRHAIAEGFQYERGLRYSLRANARLDVVDNDMRDVGLMPETAASTVAMSPLYLANKVGGASGASYQNVSRLGSVRHVSPVVVLDSDVVATATPVRALETSNARDGTIVRFVASSAAHPVFFPKVGPGWVLPAARMLAGRTYLDLQYDGAMTKVWHEHSYGVLPTASDQSALPPVRFEMPLSFVGRPHDGQLLWQVILPNVIFPANWTPECSAYFGQRATRNLELPFEIVRGGRVIATGHIGISAGSSGEDTSVSWAPPHASLGFTARQNDVLIIRNARKADPTLGDVSLLLTGDRY